MLLKNLFCISSSLFVYIFTKLFSKFDQILLIVSPPLETVQCVTDQKGACRTLRSYVRHVGDRAEIENTWFKNKSFAT